MAHQLTFTQEQRLNAIGMHSIELLENTRIWFVMPLKQTQT
jgi:hypothetical protein